MLVNDKKQIIKWIRSDISDNDIDDLKYLFYKYPEAINYALDDTQNTFVLYAWEYKKIDLALYAVENWSPNLYIENNNGLNGFNALAISFKDQQSIERLQNLCTKVNVIIIAENILKEIKKNNRTNITAQSCRI